MNKSYILIFCSYLFITNLHADEKINMEGISIIGNKELPNVLYIVPWKTPDLPDMLEPPLSTLINQSLTSIDRQAVLRKEQYYNALKEYETENLKQ
ncbi:MAG: hypothetical protein ACN4GM_16275 [Gammaproteobacteria bacterium]